MKKINLSLPLILTLSRLIIAPIILPILITLFLPYNIFGLNLFVSIIFIFFGLTDFLDGYFARKYNQVTDLGRLLDPTADKFLVSSVLIALVLIRKIFIFWAIILICRELFISCLRLFAQEKNLSIQVSEYGKIKSTMQYLAIAIIIANPYNLLGFNSNIIWNTIEQVTLLMAIILSVYSAFKYYQELNKLLKINSSDSEFINLD